MYTVLGPGVGNAVHAVRVVLLRSCKSLKSSIEISADTSQTGIQWVYTCIPKMFKSMKPFMCYRSKSGLHINITSPTRILDLCFINMLHLCIILWICDTFHELSPGNYYNRRTDRKTKCQAHSVYPLIKTSFEGIYWPFFVIKVLNCSKHLNDNGFAKIV